MQQQKIKAEALDRYARYFTIGFARLLQTSSGESAESAGSGTLVTVDSLYGVLTAAHVLEALPKYGNVGIILNAENLGQYSKLVINMDHTEPVIIKGEEFGPLGPDLAFLRLTDGEALGWLKAKNLFYSLSQRRDSVLSGHRPTKTYSDNITGTIHELTTEEPRERRNVRRITFRNIFCPVRPSAVRFLNTHDLLYVQLATEHEPAFKIPNSFEGTSGGSVWRFFVTEKDGNPEIVESRLIAVPFHQSLTEMGRERLPVTVQEASTGL
jgi:hypothetical protein